MITEQINLETVKTLIEGAKHLKSQLVMLNEQLESVTAERDSLMLQVQNQDAQFIRDKHSLNTQHASEVDSLRTKLQKEINDLRKNSKDELERTVASCDEKLQETVTSYETKLQQVTEELTQKNNKLLKELQQMQKSHKAVIDRIRGLEE